MNVRPLIGLLGVLVATMSSEFNDAVVSAALGDIRGAIGIGSDAGTWIETIFTSGLACGMAFSPWLAVTLSPRRFALSSALRRGRNVPHQVNRQGARQTLSGVSRGLLDAPLLGWIRA